MEHIIYLPEYGVVVCKQCQYAILPSEISSHFERKRPHHFTKAVRQQITQKVAEIQGLIQDQGELKGCIFPFPIDTAEPVTALGEPKANGFRCTIQNPEGTCPYISTALRKMRTHYWTEHKWKSTDKGGRRRKSNITQQVQKVPWRSGVKYQRFFKQGAKSGFFEVGRAIQSEQVVQVKSIWEIFQEKASHEFCRIEDIQARKIEATDESKEPNPWLRRTGWARHLGGFDQVKMRDLVRPADENEPELQAIHEAFRRLIKASIRVAVTDIVGQATLFEAHRKEASKKATKPFNSRMDKTTFKVYTDVWNQLLSYIWRADDLEEEERPKYKITIQQQEAFDHLIDVVDVVIQSESGPEEYYDNHYSNQPRPETDEARLESAVLELCITLLDHQFGDHQYESVIISGLAVLGLQEGGQWANAEDYTPKLSAVIKLARLIVVYKVYTLRKQSIQRRVENGVSEQEAEESTPSHHKLIRRLTRRFMTLVDSLEEPHPMDWILDTRTYGLYIRYHIAAEGTISWKGDTVLYQQIQFNMQQLRSMIHGLVAETRGILIQDLLLLQMDDHGDIQGEALPRIDWVNTVDNPTEQKLGWSFLKDIRNQFESTNPGRDWLAKRVIERPGLHQEFIQSVGSDGIQWRNVRVDQYYRRIEQFQEQLLILMHITGGQAARAPEIISIRHRNTANGGVRNIFIDAGLVLFVTAYHKGYEYSEKPR